MKNCWYIKIVTKQQQKKDKLNWNHQCCRLWKKIGMNFELLQYPIQEVFHRKNRMSYHIQWHYPFIFYFVARKQIISIICIHNMTLSFSGEEIPFVGFLIHQIKTLHKPSNYNIICWAISKLENQKTLTIRKLVKLVGETIKSRNIRMEFLTPNVVE